MILKCLSLYMYIYIYMRALTDWFGKPLPNPPTSGKDKGQAPVKQVGLS